MKTPGAPGRHPARMRRAAIAGMLALASTAPAADVERALLAPDRARDLLDDRAPLVLPAHMAAHQKADMRRHLEAVAAIVAALGREDYAAIAAAASGLGATPETIAMCRRIGAGAPPEFTDRALAFHHTADRLAAAAATRERAPVLAALGALLDGCTGCHARYRQEILTPAP